MSSKPSILYIDDEKSNLTSFKYQFNDIYKIYIAESADEGYEILQSNHVDVIIADQRMPKMTGTKFFEKIIPEFPLPARMILTGFSDINAVIEGINIGKIYYYLQKPWKEEEIKLVIKNALDSIALVKQNQELLEELKIKNNELKIQITKKETEIEERKKIENELRELKNNLEKKVKERTSELENEIEERKAIEEQLREKQENLELFNKAMVGRELKIIEIKKEVNELLIKLGEEPKYKMIE